ncbi:MAG: UDP-N-acetylmuramoyl-L-alanine--D-glutamate ligase [Chloroflexi bacterium]|nr:MAG: UDP-N-acetylmuramoyl-L-alanine--D-glutamate ligase [Chloroflexota bacterium]
MSGDRAVVIGLGRSGLACARTLAGEGYRVLVVDRNDGDAQREAARSLPSGVDVRLGGYADDIAVGAAMVCPSPGVPWDAPELQAARQHGVPVHSEMDLVFMRCRGKLVGITGTNGKTTTTSLVAAILQRAGFRVHLGGNIGATMLDRLDTVHAGDWVVLELSSFQLETIAEPACSIAAVLNVTPDHLDRHRTMQAYTETKQRLVRFAVDDVVIGHDDHVSRAMAGLARAPARYFGFDIGSHDGSTVHDEHIVSIESGQPTAVLPVADVPLFGRHNVLNVLAAVAVSRAAGAPHDAAAGAVRDFHPVPHRLQTVLDEDGILWVNDSKATNVDSALMALRSFGDRPIVWIGGGQGAGTSSDALVDEIAARARLAVLNGASAPELDRALAERGFAARSVVATLVDAVEEARRLAVAGDVVLLAPGFKSFDQFRDFEERGDVFAAQVRRLRHAAQEQH